MNRSSWFAIRAPLSPRRATVVKFASFLAPLVLWALVCFFWFPEVVINDPGDTRYRVGGQVDRKEFKEKNAQLAKLNALEDRPYSRQELEEALGAELLGVELPRFRFILTAQSLQGLRSTGVPESVLAKLAPLKDRPYNRQQLVNILNEKLAGEAAGSVDVVLAQARLLREPPRFTLTARSLEALRSAGVPEPVFEKLKAVTDLPFTQQELVEALEEQLPGDLAKYRDVVQKQAETENKKLAVGEPANPIWLPSPLKVAQAFYLAFVTPPPVKDDPWLHQSLWHSCQIIFWGFILSAIIGVPLGVLCGTFDLFSKLSEPFVDFIRYMPAPAFGVLCMAILGIYDGPKIAIIWIGTFFQMVLVVANTTRQFDESLLEAAQTLGASRRSLLTKVILPGILPSLYNDMRILIGWAWTYLIVAELIGATSGISHFINQQGKFRHFENVYAGIIMIGIIGLLVDQILAALAPYLFPWQPKSERKGAWAAFFGSLAFLIKLGQKPSPANSTVSPVPASPAGSPAAGAPVKPSTAP